jgi:hypothetical protein
MTVLKIIAKILLLPAVAVLTIVQWAGIFLNNSLSVVFNLLAGLFFLVGVSSYILGLTAGSEALKILIVGFVIFMVPIMGDVIVTAISLVNTRLREFYHS